MHKTVIFRMACRRVFSSSAFILLCLLTIISTGEAANVKQPIATFGKERRNPLRVNFKHQDGALLRENNVPQAIPIEVIKGDEKQGQNVDQPGSQPEVIYEPATNPDANDLSPVEQNNNQEVSSPVENQNGPPISVPNQKIQHETEDQGGDDYSQRPQDDGQIGKTTPSSSFFMRRHGGALRNRKTPQKVVQTARRIELPAPNPRLQHIQLEVPPYRQRDDSEPHLVREPRPQYDFQQQQRQAALHVDHRHPHDQLYERLPPNPKPLDGRLPWQWKLEQQRRTSSTMDKGSNTKSATDRRMKMLGNKLKLGEVGMVPEYQTDFVAGYGDKQLYAIRYSPPPKSEPWPMPQIFIGHDELYEIDPSQLTFKMSDKTSELLGSTCETLQKIMDRYKNGLLFRSARPIAIDDPVLHPGAVYLPSAEFPPENQDNSSNSFFQRKVMARMNKAPQVEKWLRMGVSVKTVVISTSVCTYYPTENTKESYSLRVTDKEIVIRATEIWGVLYALETLSQLIFMDENDAFMVRAASVEDWPRFSHRGLLLDSSRHFLPVSILKKNIDAMVQNKFNVFHWHLSDDQSFPLYLSSFPEFAKLAAFSPDEIYEPNDVSEIVEYARLRGIRVMPEIDSPSHVLSWRHFPKNILTRCYGNDALTGDIGPLDPTNEETYKVLEKILSDVGQLFPDAAFHAGGDEVPKLCWTANPNITEFRRKYFEEHGGGTSSPVSPYQKNNYNSNFGETSEPGMISLQELVAIYNKRLQDIFKATRPSKTKSGEEPYMVMWEEAYENDQTISRDVIMHVWKSTQNTLKFLIDEGFGVIYSQCWYLNVINYGVDWMKFYTCDPAVFGDHGLTLMNDDRGIFGGEVCLWGEYIDETNLMPLLWPRASAVAERLWSSRSVNDVAPAARRLEEHRCRMIRRGIPAAPISGPGTCGSSAFVSASELWQKEFRPEHSQETKGDIGEGRPSKKPVVIQGSRAALYFDPDTGDIKKRTGKKHQNRGDQHEAFMTIRFDYGNGQFSEIAIDAPTLICLWTIIIFMFILIWMSRRRSGLKYFRPVVSICRSSLERKSANSFIATPSPRPRSNLSENSSSCSSSVVKQQNLD